TLTGGRPEFEALIRQTRLGHGPIFMVGCGSSYLVGLTGVYAFEGLLGRPVIARPALDFRAYSASTLATGSVVFAVSHSGETTGASRVGFDPTPGCRPLLGAKAQGIGKPRRSRRRFLSSDRAPVGAARQKSLANARRRFRTQHLRGLVRTARPAGGAGRSVGL